MSGFSLFFFYFMSKDINWFSFLSRQCSYHKISDVFFMRRYCFCFYYGVERACCVVSFGHYFLAILEAVYQSNVCWITTRIDDHVFYIVFFPLIRTIVWFFEIFGEIFFFLKKKCVHPIMFCFEIYVNMLFVYFFVFLKFYLLMLVIFF